MSDIDPIDLPLYAADRTTTAVAAGPGSLRSGGAVFLVVALVAVGAALVFTVSSFLGSSGPDSPEAAVEGLINAIEREDVIGALEALDPAERRVLEPAALDLAAELERLGIVEGLDLRGVRGVDIEFDGYELVATRLTNDIVSVGVEGGTFSGETNPGDLPLGRVLLDSLEDDESSSTTEDISDLNLVAVEKAGGWYVSLGYTAAEFARTTSGEALPAFDDEISPVGGDSPEAAVRQLVQSGVDLDPRTAISMLAPDEMAALYDYGPLLLQDWEAETAAGVGDQGFSLEVGELELVTEGSGSVSRVRITSLSATWTDEYSYNELIFDDGCIEVYYEDRYDSEFSGYPNEEYWTRDRFCEGGEYTSQNSYDEEWTNDYGGYGWPAPFPMPELIIAVVQVDDRWFVSPTRTLLDAGLDLFQRLDPSDVEGWFSSDSASCIFDCSGSFTSDFYPPEIEECLSSTGEVYEEALARFAEVADDAARNRAAFLEQKVLGSCLENLRTRSEIDDDQLADFSWTDDCLAAYEGFTPETAEEDWRRADGVVAECYDDLYAVSATYSGEPRVLGDLVLVPYGDQLIAVNPDTDETVWESPDCLYPTWATVFDGYDTPITVAICDGAYRGIDVVSGDVLWTNADLGPADRSRIGQGVLVLQSDELLQVVDLATGQERWSEPDIGDANPALDSQRVYTSTNDLITAYDSQTGVRLWSLPYGASGLRADESGLYARLAGPHRVRRIDPAVLDANPNPLPDQPTIWDSITETGGVGVSNRLAWSDLVATSEFEVVALTTRDEDRLTVYDKGSGERLWILDAGDEGSLYAATTDDAIVVSDWLNQTVTLYDGRSGAVREVLSTSATSTASARGNVVSWIELDDEGVQQLRIRRL